jgi:hypothetical protein
MNRYWKLLNWEISRFGKLYAVLLLATMLLQFVGVLLYAFGFMNSVNKTMDENSLTLSQYIVDHGKITFEYYLNSSLWFVAPIALGAVTLLLYVFLIWYKEWFGKSTFVYRLFMLPTSRMNVYLAKLTAILIFILGLAAFQLLIFQLQILTFNAIISSELRDSLSMVEIIARNPYLKLLYPSHFIEFLLYYSLGVMGIIVVFTAILLERSFRIKGIAAGVAYGITVVFLIVLPLLIKASWFPNYFYPSEIFWMVVVEAILITNGSLWFSSFLLNKKITV